MKRDWFLRAAIIQPVLVLLALIIKWYLIEPYSVNVIEFESVVDQIFRSEKGDRI